LLSSVVVKKALMAATGVGLFLFVTAHLLGNLQVFLGPEAINEYAAMLKGNREILWGARSGLIVMVLVHIITTIQLAKINRTARPVAYQKKANKASSTASRSMYLTGPMIALFIVYHLLHFTVGSVHPQFSETDVYSNMVNGFRVLPVSVVYIAAMALLCLHLRHGVQSMFQTLGFNHPKHTARIKAGANAISLLYFAGFASIPLAALTGVLRPMVERL
jgi:succinate dehydrogenase / fumarate reductase cytochrome b subunit